jgi:hypothetical protein
MLYHKIAPFGLQGGASAPVQRWAFAGRAIEEIEAIGNDGKRGSYA